MRRVTVLTSLFKKLLWLPWKVRVECGLTSFERETLKKKKKAANSWNHDVWGLVVGRLLMLPCNGMLKTLLLFSKERGFTAH